MQHYPGQGNPVLRALTGELSTRQLEVMIRHLPPENVAMHELHDMVSFRDLFHDLSDQLRILRAEIFNIVRDPKHAPIDAPDLLPRPDMDAGVDPEDAAQVKVEQDHFLAVLNRPNPH